MFMSRRSDAGVRGYCSIKRASLSPCRSLCGSRGKGLTSAQRTVDSSRLRAVNLRAEHVPGRGMLSLIELVPRGPQGARASLCFCLPAALAGCSACVSGPRRTSQRASSAVEGARCGLGWDEWQQSDRARFGAWCVWCAPGQELRNREFLIL
ncbi:hypothetical protein B0H13DRAFT_2138163 [Mycena leptocephala]|nr:hypothetical protein B0H13DRAFT_2138163 [Mycena leptocephala]